MVVAMQVVLKTSRRGCRFILTMLQYILQLAFMRSNPTLSAQNQKILADFPIDADTATSKFNLGSKHTIYAVCPNLGCHKMYAPSTTSDSPIPNYPQYCDHQEFQNERKCGTRLTRPHSIEAFIYEVPIKRFVSFSFTDYLAGLMSRPGFEDRMDNPLIVHGNESNVANDIFDGQFLREFKGPDGQLFRSSHHIGRYCFSLCVDFFNPFTNKQAGKKCSVGIISLVCLNLPASMRYKAENMFLAGVIPGPKEPSKGCLNHYLTPLVDELLVFWSPGVKYSRTHNYADGRLVLCALIAVVCDLLAARATGGFASVTHEHFCSFCHCRRSTDGYGRTDYASWRRKTNEECRKSAQDYKDAVDVDSRLDKFNETGMRWSELLRLPYFNIARCVVVDSMHNLFLGLIKEHFTGILGIGNVTYREPAVLQIAFASLPADFGVPNTKSVQKLKNWLEAPLTSAFPLGRNQACQRLASLHLNALRFGCEQVGCLPEQGRTKKKYAEALVNWVCLFRYFS